MASTAVQMRHGKKSRLEGEVIHLIWKSLCLRYMRAMQEDQEAAGYEGFQDGQPWLPLKLSPICGYPVAWLQGSRENIHIHHQPLAAKKKGSDASVSRATLGAKSGPAVVSSKWETFQRCHSWGRQMNSDTSVGDPKCWTLEVRPNAGPAPACCDLAIPSLSLPQVSPHHLPLHPHCYPV